MHRGMHASHDSLQALHASRGMNILQECALAHIPNTTKREGVRTRPTGFLWSGGHFLVDRSEMKEGELKEGNRRFLQFGEPDPGIQSCTQPRSETQTSWFHQSGVIEYPRVSSRG